MADSSRAKASARRMVAQWYVESRSTLKPREDIVDCLFYAIRLTAQDEDRLREWCPEEKKDQVLCELLFLKVFAVSFGTWRTLGIRGKEYSDGVVAQVLNSIPGADALKFELLDRLTRYAKAYESAPQAPHRNPFQAVGKIFADCCGTDDSIGPMFFAVIELAAIFGLVGEFLTNVTPDKPGGEVRPPTNAGVQPPSDSEPSSDRAIHICETITAAFCGVESFGGHAMLPKELIEELEPDATEQVCRTCLAIRDARPVCIETQSDERTPTAETSTATLKPKTGDTGKSGVRSVLKGIGGFVVGTIGLIALFALVSILMKGSVWLGEKIIPWLTVLSVLAFTFSLVILGPMALIGPTRRWAGGGYLIASYVFGVTAWFMGLVLTWELWGGFAVIIGMVLLAVGVVPMAILATLFKGEWPTSALLVLTASLAFGCRMLGIHLGKEQSQPPPVSTGNRTNDPVPTGFTKRYFFFGFALWILKGWTGRIALAVTLVMALAWPWWWLAVAILALIQYWEWQHTHGRPWRRIHFPVMQLAMEASAMETIAAQREGRPYDGARTVAILLHKVLPDCQDGTIRAFIEREFARARNFDDAELIEAVMRKCNPKWTRIQLKEVMERSRVKFASLDNFIMLRMAIAGLIEEKHGLAHRGEYLFEVINGHA